LTTKACFFLGKSAENRPGQAPSPQVASKSDQVGDKEWITGMGGFS